MEKLWSSSVRLTLSDGTTAVIEESSDIDLLLIARELPQNPFQRRLRVQEPLLQARIPAVSVLAHTVGEFTADVTPLHLDLAVDANILYDPEGFLASRLERVRELIAEAGLEPPTHSPWLGVVVA